MAAPVTTAGTAGAVADGHLRREPARRVARAFEPQGFLVLIFEDAAEAGLAKAALQDAGFAEGDLRVYSGEQILADHDRYLAQRSLTQRVVGALTDDRGTIELYFGYAREGRAALWVRVPDRSDANRALRHLADQRGPPPPLLRPLQPGGHPLPLSGDSSAPGRWDVSSPPHRHDGGG